MLLQDDSRRARAGRAALERLGLLAALAGVVSSAAGCFATDVEGRIDATGDPLGTWTIFPDDCASGQRMEFFGVWLLQEDDPYKVVTLVHDPLTGPVVQVTIPSTCSGSSCEAVQLDRASGCDTLDVVLERTSSQVNDIWNMDGSLRFDCRVGSGRLSGDVVFENCH